MQVYRLIKEKYAADPLDTEGARLAGGRWNSKGQAVLYASDSRALAALEKLVHLHDTTAMNAFVFVTVDLPDDEILWLDDKVLPDHWRDDPLQPGTQAIGDEWLSGQDSLALSVPSTVIVQQSNLLINPGHPDYEILIDQVGVEAFEFDTRLLR